MITTVAGNSRPAGPEYHFSLERLSELNRSPIPLLLSRLNSDCPSYGKSSAEIDDPSGLIAEIRAHCADDDDFIHRSMPLQEIVFRTLLLNGDEPMALADLHRELTERWSSPIRPITVTSAGLARILDNDVFYGFAAVPVEEPEVAELDLPMLTASEIDDPALFAEALAAVAEDLDDDEDDEDQYDDDEDDDAFDDDEDDFDD